MSGFIVLTGNEYSGMIGKLPFNYFRGNIYTMVMYNYNINVILIEATIVFEKKSIVNKY